MSTPMRPLAAILGAAALTLVAACGTQGSSSTGAAAPHAPVGARRLAGRAGLARGR